MFFAKLCKQTRYGKYWGQYVPFVEPRRMVCILTLRGQSEILHWFKVKINDKKVKVKDILHVIGIALTRGTERCFYFTLYCIKSCGEKKVSQNHAWRNDFMTSLWRLTRNVKIQDLPNGPHLCSSWSLQDLAWLSRRVPEIGRPTIACHAISSPVKMIHLTSFSNSYHMF